MSEIKLIEKINDQKIRLVQTLSLEDLQKNNIDLSKLLEHYNLIAKELNSYRLMQVGCYEGKIYLIHNGKKTVFPKDCLAYARAVKTFNFAIKILSWTHELWDDKKFIIFNRLYWRTHWHFEGSKPNHLTLPEKCFIKHLREGSDPLGTGTIARCLERSSAGIHNFVKRMGSDKDLLAIQEIKKKEDKLIAK
jgi:hypothetical protein